MTLLTESENADHPWKSEEKTQNTDSHNLIELEQPIKLERQQTHHNKHKTPHRSEENQAIDKEV